MQLEEKLFQYLQSSDKVKNTDEKGCFNCQLLVVRGRPEMKLNKGNSLRLFTLSPSFKI
jgi:hypothetical protein